MRNLSLALVALTCCACAPALENPDVVHDSTGLEFGWSCTDSQFCQIGSGPSSLDFEPPSCSGGRTWGAFWGRFYEVCIACLIDDVGWSAAPEDCRPLACASDRDCPEFITGGRLDAYECADGLCQNVDQSRHPRDVLRPRNAQTLCYAPVPRAETVRFDAPAVVTRREALDAECPLDAASCELPAACAWP